MGFKWLITCRERECTRAHTHMHTVNMRRMCIQAHTHAPCTQEHKHRWVYSHISSPRSPMEESEDRPRVTREQKQKPQFGDVSHIRICWRAGGCR